MATGPEVQLPEALAVMTPCRVCGTGVAADHVLCRRCGTPRARCAVQHHDTNWIDVTMATGVAMMTLALALPTTFVLSESLWRGWLTRDAMSAAVTISTLNGWLIGLPVGAVLWRWRERAVDGDIDDSPTLREYWQIQGLCLMPIAMISLFIGAMWLCLMFL